MNGWKGLTRILPVVTLAVSAAPALAQTVAVTVNGVSTADGVLRGQLCTDTQKFPAGACPYKVEAPAAMGMVKLVFAGVPEGTYAFQSMHDANANGRLDLPHEGFAFGNSVPWPPTFDKAAIKVAGDTAAEVTLTYFSQGTTAITQGGTAGAEIGVAARDGVVKTDVRFDGLYGAFYAPKDAKNLPVIIAIGGSEGGLNPISGISAGFARRGYAVLALAYWRAPGLPKTLQNVPLEYFSTAIDWVQARPEVDASRIGMIGWSRGGEGALLIASGEPRIKAVIGLAPGSHVVAGLNFENPTELKPAWTKGGKAVPFFSWDTSVPYTGNMRAMMDKSHATIMAHPEAEIPVEKINGPVLLLSGDKDGVWNAALNSERVLARLKKQGFKHDAKHIDYPGAGHLVFKGDPEGQAYELDAATLQFMGGSTEANAAAQRDAWSKGLAFFDGALKGGKR